MTVAVPIDLCEAGKAGHDRDRVSAEPLEGYPPPDRPAVEADRPDPEQSLAGRTALPQDGESHEVQHQPAEFEAEVFERVAHQGCDARPALLELRVLLGEALDPAGKPAVVALEFGDLLSGEGLGERGAQRGRADGVPGVQRGGIGVCERLGTRRRSGVFGRSSRRVDLGEGLVHRRNRHGIDLGVGGDFVESGTQFDDRLGIESGGDEAVPDAVGHGLGLFGRLGAEECGTLGQCDAGAEEGHFQAGSSSIAARSMRPGSHPSAHFGEQRHTECEGQERERGV